MKMFRTKSILKVLGISFALCFIGSITSFAATVAPNLGVAIGYSVFGNAGVTDVGGSSMWGDVGENGFGNGSTLGEMAGTLHAAAEALVVGAISTAYGDLAAQPQTGVGVLDLHTSPSVGPGVYNVAGTTFDSPLTLTGDGIYIFRSTGSIAQSAGGTMILTGGATACKVYWQIPTSMTFTANAGSIEGTIITNTGNITLGSGISLKGRAWGHAGVTLDHNVITEPVCAAAPQQGMPKEGTLNVIKTVINDNGGTKKVADFPLFVNGTPVTSGITNVFHFPNDVYTATEVTNSNYVQSFTGDCDRTGHGSIQQGSDSICIITNNDIGAPTVVPPVPPLIEVVKVPNPLALPKGPGPVIYTYTLRNIGTVPVTDITMVGDSCSPIKLISGDTNSDSKLDVTETWSYTCSTTLSKTHTNTVVATGWANGISATDIANATVVVGSTVPPLIHVTKVPDPLALPAGGGKVTYTEKITNPGTVALSNVKLIDDKCNPMGYVYGDTNSNKKLEPTETWIYSCESNLSETTTNTAVASGEGNGLTVKDFAIATVVVASAVPALPNTGFGNSGNNILLIALVSGVFAISLLIYVIRKKENV